MATMRCPYHDYLFESDTDHTKPGTRAKNPAENNRNTGAHIHPRYMVSGGFISGHPDCPLCQNAIENDDKELMQPDEPVAAQSPIAATPERSTMRVAPPPQKALGRRVPLNG
jgi:hypothetical protein